MTSKVVLVTGAARRIGAAIARDLATVGWAVAVHYNASGDAAALIVDEVIGSGGRAMAIDADLMDEAQVQALVGRVSEALGPVTDLVNNASVFDRDDALTATRDTWDRHLQINLRAPFVLTQAFARQLPAHERGCVVNLLDQRVWNLTPHFTSYTLSKTGLWTLTQTLALALAPRIRVNAVGPGPTLPSSRQSEQDFARQWSLLPLARPVSPQDIAEAVRFLLDAPTVTGQMIAVDAGQHLGWCHTHASPLADE
jgi:NAD(P)-dependent dehydrogenase (short-subunit alcohol dehydrogenase family)